MQESNNEQGQGNAPQDKSDFDKFYDWLDSQEGAIQDAYRVKEELLRRVLIGDQSAMQEYTLACDKYEALLNQSTLSKLGLKTEVK